ncbi:hypothetical protein DZJ_35380 [Dickeya ananatis]
MKLASFINPENGVKTFGMVNDNGLIDLGGRLPFSDLAALLRANALTDLPHYAEADFSP